MKERNVITNITINEVDLYNNWPTLLEWQKDELIHGIGISITKKLEEIKEIVKYLNNTVAHTIYGITTLEDYEWISKSFDKVLVLGYKNKGRGKSIIPTNKIDIKELYRLFKIVSFDNLGIEQSNVKELVTKEEWEQSYMGEEATISFYIDTVEEKYYKSSIEIDGFNIGSKSVIEMFNDIRSK